MGQPGKPEGISGGEVEKYYRDGYVRQIAEYCESGVWLRYELFRGRLSDAELRWPRLSEQFLRIDKWSVCRG
jgi:hypothetical protein